jgi:membrane protease YdiL (CAAX protease family)
MQRQYQLNVLSSSVYVAMWFPLLGSLLYYVLLAGEPVALGVYALTKVFTVVWPIVAAIGLRRSWTGLKLPQGSSVRAVLTEGLLLALAISGAIVAVYLITPLGDMIAGNRKELLAKATDMKLTTPSRFVGFAVFLSLVNAGFEEFFWRWYVFGELQQRIALVWAYLLASVSFAAHHLVVVGTMFPLPVACCLAAGVATGGFLWCWLYRRHGTIWGAWLSHVLVDVAILAIGYQLLFS